MPSPHCSSRSPFRARTEPRPYRLLPSRSAGGGSSGARHLWVHPDRRLPATPGSLKPRHHPADRRVPAFPRVAPAPGVVFDTGALIWYRLRLSTRPAAPPHGPSDRANRLHPRGCSVIATQTANRSRSFTRSISPTKCSVFVSDPARYRDLVEQGGVGGNGYDRAVGSHRVCVGPCGSHHRRANPTAVRIRASSAGTDTAARQLLLVAEAAELACDPGSLSEPMPGQLSIGRKRNLERHTQSQHPTPGRNTRQASRKTGSVNLPGEGGLTGILAR
jgi:hypothetical protein